MAAAHMLTVAVYLLVLLGLAWPLGLYMAAVLEGRPGCLGRVLGPLERLVYRLCGVDPQREMDWKSYALAMFLFSMAGFVVLYGLERLQGLLPLNPDSLGAVAPDLAFNTALSFVTNTNWQAYGGESTMSYLTQMVGLTVHNFVSAATGIGVLAALIRGLTRQETRNLGNFWADLVRSTLYILLPLSVGLALALVWQGVPQTFQGTVNATLAAPVAYEVTPSADDLKADPSLKPKPATATGQALARGPVASQEAIKMLGTNGGGFFNANSAHPFENPTPLTNFLEMLAILLIPAALCHTFGRMAGDARQGWVLLAAMTIIFLGFLSVCLWAEHAGVPQMAALTGGHGAGNPLPGNWEGKELRFGVTASALWATATTAASNGSVNAMHDSFTPLGGLVPMALMQLGEVVFGGVGSGLYSMLVFAIIVVFIAGLMVGRTPEYLGKKIEAFETKMCSLVIMVPLFGVLLGTAWAVLISLDGAASGKGAILNPGAHGFSEILYAFSSMANNNGSAFAGLNANLPLYNLLGGLVMFTGRFWLAIPVLALAGSLAAKKRVPVSAGTLPTHTPLFCGLLVSVVLVVGALTFIPALALGPIVEHLMMLGHQSAP